MKDFGRYYFLIAGLAFVSIISIGQCQKPEPEKTDFECSIKFKAEKTDKVRFYYSVAFDRPERLIIESEFWIRQDAQTYCLAAFGSVWSNGNVIREMSNLEIIDTGYYERMIDIKDTSDLRINATAYEQSLNDYQNKNCSTSFFYKK